jgi:tetrahydromethanopterin S-methyltransferase subunit G
MESLGILIGFVYGLIAIALTINLSRRWRARR